MQLLSVKISSKNALYINMVEFTSIHGFWKVEIKTAFFSPRKTP